ncbi:MAG: hypothetical protein ACTSUE_02735 [Promethearchaeota archaeon]
MQKEKSYRRSGPGSKDEWGTRKRKIAKRDTGTFLQRGFPTNAGRNEACHPMKTDPREQPHRSGTTGKVPGKNRQESKKCIAVEFQHIRWNRGMRPVAIHE